MKVCPTCIQQNSNDSLFCTGCGDDLQAVAIIATAAPLPSNAAPSARLPSAQPAASGPPASFAPSASGNAGQPPAASNRPASALPIQSAVPAPSSPPSARPASGPPASFAPPASGNAGQPPAASNRPAANMNPAAPGASAMAAVPLPPPRGSVRPASQRPAAASAGVRSVTPSGVRRQTRGRNWLFGALAAAAVLAALVLAFWFWPSDKAIVASGATIIQDTEARGLAAAALKAAQRVANAVGRQPAPAPSASPPVYSPVAEGTSSFADCVGWLEPRLIGHPQVRKMIGVGTALTRTDVHEAAEEECQRMFSGPAPAASPTTPAAGGAVLSRR